MPGNSNLCFWRPKNIAQKKERTLDLLDVFLGEEGAGVVEIC